MVLRVVLVVIVVVAVVLLVWILVLRSSKKTASPLIARQPEPPGEEGLGPAVSPLPPSPALPEPSPAPPTPPSISHTAPTAELAEAILSNYYMGGMRTYDQQHPLLTRDLVEHEPVSALLAVRIIADVAEQAYTVLLSSLRQQNVRRRTNYVLQGRGYYDLFQSGVVSREEGFGLVGTPLWNLPCRFHPYIHLRAAVAFVALRPAACLAHDEPTDLLAHLAELLELVVAAVAFPFLDPSGHGAGGGPNDGHLMIGLLDAVAAVRGQLDAPPPLNPFLERLLAMKDPVELTVSGFAVTEKILDRNGRVTEVGHNTLESRGMVDIGAETRQRLR